MAMMNLTRLQDEAGTRIRNSSILDAQWTIWANNAQDEIASKIELNYLEHEISVDTVDGTRTYYVDEFLPGLILSVWDEDNAEHLDQRTESKLLEWDGEQDSEGNPTDYSLSGLSHVEGQPSTASTIDIVSASASDTTQKVRIRGIVSDAEDYELITLTGTTAATGSKSFSEVRSITKDGVTSGKITVTDTTGSTTLAVLPRARYGVEYQKINLYPIPDDAYTLKIRGIRRPLDLVNGEDVPELPETFHELVLIGMLIRGHEYLLDFNRANELKALFELKIKELQKLQGNKSDWIPYLPHNTRVRRRTWGKLPPDYEA